MNSSTDYNSDSKSRLNTRQMDLVCGENQARKDNIGSATDNLDNKSDSETDFVSSLENRGNTIQVENNESTNDKLHNILNNTTDYLSSSENNRNMLDLEKNAKTLSQIHTLKSWYGPLEEYIKNAKFCYKNYCNNLDSKNLDLKMPKNLRIGLYDMMYYEKIGILGLERCAFVLVAGGIGERLSYNDIKLTLETELFTHTSYLEYYIEYIDSIFIRYKKIKFDNCNSVQDIKNIRKPPFIIMTSKNTKKRTSELLDSIKAKGKDIDHIMLVEQNQVPTFKNASFELAIDKNTNELITKPYGHGDVHGILNRIKIVNQWKKREIKWIMFFQDSNILMPNSLLSMIGVSSKFNVAANFLTVDRKENESLGIFCNVQNKESNREICRNVEYNIVQKLEKCGDEKFKNISKGLPGNTNIFVVRIDKYIEALNKYGGKVPEFINLKLNSFGEFKCPIRLETMMQDIVFLFDSSSSVITTTVPRLLCYSAAKNNIDIANYNHSIGLSCESPVSAENDLFRLNKIKIIFALQLNKWKYYLADSSQTENNNNLLNDECRIILKGGFSSTLTSLVEKFRNCTSNNSFYMTKSSLLVLDGEIYFTGNVFIDGICIITAKNQSSITVKNLMVDNQSSYKNISLNKNDKNLTPNDKVRGYKLSIKGKIRKIESSNYQLIVNDRFNKQSMKLDHLLNGR